MFSKKLCGFLKGFIENIIKCYGANRKAKYTKTFLFYIAQYHLKFIL